MLVGGDFNGDVVSNMDRVFQIVIRSERWVNPPFWGGGEIGNFAEHGGISTRW